MGFFDSDVERDLVYETPEDFKSGLADLLAEAKKIYAAKKKLGFQDYEGERIADFTPEEEAAMAGIAGLVGEGKKYFDPATDLAKGLSEKFTAETAQEYMSPYQQAVTDVAKRKAREDFEQTMQDIGLKSALGGGRRGTARAIVEAEGVQDLGQRLSDIQTLGSQSAFQDARKAFEAQKGRERLSGSALASLGQQVPEQALKELTALAGVGEAQRGMDQSGLDLAYQNFLQKQQYPYDVLGQYQSTLYGYPYQAYQTAKGTSAPSGFQNLMSVLNTGKSLFPKVFGFGNTGGQIGNLAFRSEGGLSGLTATYQEGTKDKTVGSSKAPETITRGTFKEAFTNFLSSQAGVGEELKKLNKIREELAKKRMERLAEKDTFMNRLGQFAEGVAEGYDPNKPQTMAGSLAAGARNVKSPDELQKEEMELQEQIAKGNLSSAQIKAKLAQAGFTGLGSYIKALRDIRPDLQFNQSSLMNIAEKKYAVLGNPAAQKKLAEKIQLAIDNFVKKLPNLGNLNSTQQEQAILAELDKIMKEDKTSSVGESGFNTQGQMGKGKMKAKEIRDIHTK